MAHRFSETKFGISIHWGLYAIPGGVWQGMDVLRVSEWVMRKYKIPIREYGKDVLQELSEACRKFGIRLGVYYPQDQDWHERGASGNTWDFPEAEKTPDAIDAYLQKKVKPRLHEQLTRYGNIGIAWFDTPVQIKKERSNFRRRSDSGYAQ